jgi:hypothetical protein
MYACFELNLGTIDIGEPVRRDAAGQVGEAEGQIRVHDGYKLLKRAERTARRGQGGRRRTPTTPHADRVGRRRQRRQGRRRLEHHFFSQKTLSISIR